MLREEGSTDRRASVEERLVGTPITRM